MQKLYKPVLLVLLAFSMLSACTSKEQAFSNMREVFTTEIDEAGSKRFTYLLISRTKGLNTLGLIRSKEQFQTRQSKRGGGYERGGANNEKFKEDFIERLDEYLLANGFCRTGYIELDFTAVSTEIQLVGECNESATSQDIEKWQATQTNF
ncbi:hypothetical protein [Glaciecola petra]|uniref:Lipoprotein n=1 Tax=Glaciecola petra TaxID=3075602 RepID=A0ABU2ZPV2_9ALTE|nr:hypothetical protein [Aestuariibacter sp. P117]MDT0594658.1 hypothetical protein [Aestuariibacter sp. P117]